MDSDADSLSPREPAVDPGWGLKYTYGGDNRRGMSRAGRLVTVKDGKWTKTSEWIELMEAKRP